MNCVISQQTCNAGANAALADAVAVSLDESGALCRVVLAGKADLYDGGE
mgnify:CR=1 FL=1